MFLNKTDFPIKYFKTEQQFNINYFFITLGVIHKFRNRCLAKHIADVSWSKLMDITTYKVEWAGKSVKLVNSGNTSQMCSGFCRIVKKEGSGAKNLALLQNQWKISQLGKLINIIKGKMIHKGKNYSVKLRKYYFCTRTQDQAQ